MKSKAGQKAVQEARKGVSVRAEQTVDGWVWVRDEEFVSTLVLLPVLRLSSVA
jgi:hypothetical protein